MFDLSPSVLHNLHEIGWSEDERQDISSLLSYFVENSWPISAAIETFLESFLNLGFLFTLSTGIVMDVRFYESIIRGFTTEDLKEIHGGDDIYWIPIGSIDDDLEMVLMGQDGRIQLVSHSKNFEASCAAEFFEYLVNQQPLTEIC